jgi:hypothetical protein
MNNDIPTVPGTPFAGGFYVGCIAVAGVVHALIVSPKAEGTSKGAWNTTYDAVDGATSYFDGLANTKAMAEAGSELGKWATGLSIAGFNDWYIPSRDELELLYRHFKPTSDENYVFRNGDNPSSLPVGYPYTDTAPPQTPLGAFQEGGEEALSAEWHWSSTQRATDSGYAWMQNFSGGNQGTSHMYGEFAARAVRRLVI